MSDNPTFPTRDLGAATFLYSTDHELIETTLETSRKVIFIFKKKKDTDKLILDYFSGTALAPAKKLFESYRMLRGLVYSLTNNVRK